MVNKPHPREDATDKTVDSPPAPKKATEAAPAHALDEEQTRPPNAPKRADESGGNISSPVTRFYDKIPLNYKQADTLAKVVLVVLAAVVIIAVLLGTGNG